MQVRPSPGVIGARGPNAQPPYERRPYEGGLLERLGGTASDKTALEIGCGRGVGLEIIWRSAAGYLAVGLRVLLKVALPRDRDDNRPMSGRRRVWAGSLLLVLFTGLNLGVCVAVFSAAGGKVRCCPDVVREKASFTACCPTGQPSASSDLPLGVQTQLPPTPEIVFGFASQTSPIDPSRGHSFADIPYRSVDPQALLSTFLI